MVRVPQDSSQSCSSRSHGCPHLYTSGPTGEFHYEGTSAQSNMTSVELCPFPPQPQLPYWHCLACCFYKRWVFSFWPVLIFTSHQEMQVTTTRNYYLIPTALATTKTTMERGGLRTLVLHWGECKMVLWFGSESPPRPPDKGHWFLACGASERLFSLQHKT